MVAPFQKRDLSPKGPAGRAALARLIAADDFVIAHTDTGYTRHPVFGTWAAGGPPNILTALGYDFVRDTPDAADPLPPQTVLDWPGHGTRTLSVMIGNAPGELVGAAPGAKVIPYRVTDSPVFDMSTSSTRHLGRAIDFVLDYPHIASRVKVISISMGIPGWPLSPSKVLGAAIDRAYEAGIIIVAAAGQKTDRVTYPGRYFRTIGVGAVNADGTVWDKHDVNDEALYVDCYMLGADVLRANSYRLPADAPGAPPHTCYSGNDPDGGDDPPPHSGTSYATAQLAAVAALWRCQRDAELRAKYGAASPLITEAFRAAVKRTSSLMQGTGAFADAARIVDLEALLAAPLPDAGNAPGEIGPSPYLAVNQVS